MNIVRALDAVGDWTYGAGKANYLRERKAIKQNISTRLYSFLGDCFFKTDAGIDWFNLLGAKDVDAITKACTTVILNTQGVVGLVELSADLDHNTRNLRVVYEVNIATPDGIDTLKATTNLLLAEDGSVLTDESGNPLENG
jgi:hypothetical protein